MKDYTIPHKELNMSINRRYLGIGIMNVLLSFYIDEYM